jgi:DNA invertase Pin-like site-specific DNA recombinase
VRSAEVSARVPKGRQSKRRIPKSNLHVSNGNHFAGLVCAGRRIVSPDILADVFEGAAPGSTPMKHLAPNVTRVAQYVRMSTEDQQYSIANQQAKINEYAKKHGFAVTRTYTDSGKSGVVIKHRKGLSALLKDVVGGEADYEAVLVYDVSRWGRFQNPDEAAHYEFLCQNAGIPIHYCAEQFPNDGTLFSSMMKSLKRTMAGEYSRELGVKVVEGKKRIALLGFRVGGTDLYGLKRMVVSANGLVKHVLNPGEEKSITTDRVILMPGAKEQVETVRNIFHLTLREKKTTGQIARELNAKGIRRPSGRDWNSKSVWKILRDPQYAGYSVWGRTSKRLHGPSKARPPSEWIMTPNAFSPVVDEKTFRAAGRILSARNCALRPELEVIGKLKRLLKLKGRLTEQIILNANNVFHPGSLYNRFGSMLKVYELAGYTPPARTVKAVRHHGFIVKLRNSILNELEDRFPTTVRVVSNCRYSRKMIEVDQKTLVSLYICPRLTTKGGKKRWLLTSHPNELNNLTLICLVDPDCERIASWYVLDPIGDSLKDNETKYLCDDDPWLSRGTKIFELSSFYEAVRRASRRVLSNVSSTHLIHIQEDEP